MKITKILMILLLFYSIDCTSQDVDLKVKYVTLESLEQPGRVKIYDAGKNNKYVIKEDFWNKISMLSCGELETSPMDRKQYWPDDYMFTSKNMNCDLNSNEVIRNIREVYDKDSRARKFYGSCNQSAGVTSLRITMQQNNSIDALSKVGFVYCYAIYDIFNDSLHFVDSLYSEGVDDYHFHYGFIDSAGANFYYNKRESAIRYNIKTEGIDTLFQGETPIIPVNSSEVIVYSKLDHKLRLLNDDYSVKKSIRYDNIIPLSVFKVDEGRFVIAQRYKPKLGKVVLMKVSLFDFNSDTVTELFTDDYGEIIGIIK